MLYERHNYTPNGWKNPRLKLGPKTPVEQGGELRVTATEMETLNKEFVRLVINHRGKISTYMALSHCWGTLAKIFKDAIEVTRRMGVRHLWIDALCIVQDSQDDWASESVKMGSIYEGSLLTIAASVAGHSLGGCFNDKSMPHDHLTWGKTNTVQISPLNTRGWTYQERVLSPRTIHFAASQAVWECRELYRLEDLLASPLPRWYNSFVKNTFRTKAATVLGDGRDPDRDPVRFWYNELVSFEYSRREFTRPADCLIALAGLASIWNKQRLSGSDTYLAGIWLSRLAFGLAWERNYRDTYWSSSDSDGDDDPPSTITAAAQQQQPRPRRPTWSWTSHDGHVSWQDGSFTPAFYLEFLHSNLEYLGSASSNNNSGSKASEFSPVVVGYIAVRGLVAAAPLDTGWPLAELRGNPPENIDVDATLDGYPVVLKMDYRSHPKADDGLPLPLYALALGDEIELHLF
ncbi:heterokaryon incompatibility protein-domain-containing protein [Lasiosphaeria miniovina]|uniref:Heterokaryon incompatibility protein-domain-containing protein n=1 Tax=Lasiosphaeria miniovina TaxID=1954250 RepID=A0AA40DU65_9PEZI|nr:heterokaryon incompatibility protein-domain-containing protein [Lasiosphaeria miniovina]KAK0713527.1 heterokaryon incompatibility protein-domain-containing protein [Lasiosphaeria miniovina]